MTGKSVTSIFVTRPDDATVVSRGMDALTFWTTRPRNVVMPATQVGGVDYGETRHWEADGYGLGGRAIRKTRCEPVVNGIWKHLVNTAFANVSDEIWCNHPDFVDHCFAPEFDVPDRNTWIAEHRLRIETEPFKGSEPLPITVTGPYSEPIERLRYDPCLPVGTPEALVWILAPRIQHVAGWETFRFEGETLILYPQRSFIDTPGASDRSNLPIRQMLDFLPGDARAAVADAFARRPVDESGYPPLDWSARIELHAAPAGAPLEHSA